MPWRTVSLEEGKWAHVSTTTRASKYKADILFFFKMMDHCPMASWRMLLWWVRIGPTLRSENKMTYGFHKPLKWTWYWHFSLPFFQPEDLCVKCLTSGKYKNYVYELKSYFVKEQMMTKIFLPSHKSNSFLFVGYQNHTFGMRKTIWNVDKTKDCDVSLQGKFDIPDIFMSGKVI